MERDVFDDGRPFECWQIDTSCQPVKQECAWEKGRVKMFQWQGNIFTLCILA